MVEAGEGLFFVSDMRGSTLFTSASLDLFHGHERGSAAERSWYDLVHPDDVTYSRQFFDNALERLDSFVAWWRLARHDGAYSWVMVGGSPLVSEISGSPFAYVASIYPLDNADAFLCAGGVTCPERGESAETALLKVERVADLALMAAAMARETGEKAIATALDDALARIGSRLAQLSEKPAPVSDPMRRHGSRRRRLSSRG